MLEAPRILADWLAGTTSGVNAKLDTLDYDGADPAPTDVATIADETRNQAVARERLPTPLPCLALSVERFRQDGEVRTTVRDGSVTVLIRYGVSNSNTATATRDGYYTMRAVVESLRELHKPANVASRTRNGRCLLACEELEFVPLYQALEDGQVTAALRATYTTRDTTV